MSRIILKSYKKVRLLRPIKGSDFGDGKDVPAGNYIVRHSDKWHTTLWADRSDESFIVSTPVYLSRSGSGLIRNV